MNEKKVEEAGVLFKRVIQLPPALGDWTELAPRERFPKKLTSKRLSFWGRTPDDDLKSVHHLHYFWASVETASFKKDLAASFELHSVTLSQQRLQDFLKNDNGPLVSAKVEIKSLEGTCYLFLDQPLLEVLLNRSLGSPITVSSKPPDLEKLTALEEATLQTIFDKPTTSLFTAWGLNKEDVARSPFTLFQNALDPALAPSETFTHIEMTFSLSERLLGTMKVGYPRACLTKLLAVNKQQTVPPPSFTALPAALLGSISIPLKVVLGGTALPTRELLDLKEGDVIQLDETLDAACTLQLGASVKLSGVPGTRRERFAIKVQTQAVGGATPLPEPPREPEREPHPLEAAETESEDPFKDALETEEATEEEEEKEDDFLDF